MSGSTWLTTVGMTTADQVSCIAFEVMSSSSDKTRDDIALGVSFAVAFVVGGLLALVAAVLFFRYIARKDKVFSSSEKRDAENDDEKSWTISYQRLKRESIANEELQRCDVLVPNELHVSFHMSALIGRIGIESHDHLTLASTSEREVEFLRMDMLAVSDLERTLIEERINAKMLCMREILEAQMKRNKLAKAQVQETIGKVFYSVYNVVASVQRQYEANSETPKRKPLKDSQVVGVEMMKNYPRSLSFVTVAVQNADEVFRKSLADSTNLTADEVKAAAESLSESMARLESKLRDERIQQIIFLEESLVKRRCLSETVELREDSLVAEISGRQNAFSRVLQGLSSENTVSERTKNELQRHFTDDLKSIHSKLSQEFQRTKLNQASQLKQLRQEKLSHLTDEQRNRRGQFFVTLDRIGANNALAQTYLELCSQARRQMNELEEDLDQHEAEALESISEEFERASQKSLAEADDRLKTILRSQGRLSEHDANDALRHYLTQLQQELRMVTIERRERFRQIQEKLSSTNQKSEENAISRLRAEEEELRMKMEKLLQGVFRTQTLLTVEAKKTLQRRHEQKLSAVTNQLVMANRRCQKTLIYLNRMRTRSVEEFSHNKAQESKNSKEKKSKKSLEKLTSRKLEDVQHLEKLTKDLEEVLRHEANRTERELLADHDRFLAELIGHQVAAEARKQALENVRKDTTICKLEDRIMKELESRLDRGETLDGYLDVISQQHLTEVSEMIEEMGLARSRKDDLILEKMESRQHAKEREIASDLNQQARNQWNENKNFLVEHFERLTFQQLFQDSLAELKLDCAVETERLRAEVSVELESELHQQLMEQKKIFLAQVVALTKTSKDVIEELITGAVTEAGGDDKQASKLLKEFLLEVQKAKVNSGFDHRIPPKTKSNDSLLSFDRPTTTTKIQRSKTDLGMTYPLTSKDVMDRPKTRLEGYQNRSYLNSDDETSAVDLRRSLPQRPRSAFKHSAEV